jgi:carboxylesterase type B
MLNVYTPQLPTRDVPANKAVMVWIHGGGYFWGSGRSDLYGPAKLLNHDVVLVTINYRLGPFGFLSTGDAAAPGNAAIWDQIEALKWVQKNIRYFGGDPNRVTIFGESAGGFAVGALVVTNKAKGLFHRAITQSGSGACSLFKQSKEGLQAVEWLAKKAGCPTGSSHEMIDCLQHVPAADIVTIYYPSKITATTEVGLPLYPVVDGDLFTASPLKYLRDGDFNKVPFMAGTTGNEGDFFYLFFGGGGTPSADFLKMMLTPWMDVIGFTKEPGMVDQILSKYLTNLDTMDTSAARTAISNLMDDVFMSACTNRTAIEVSRHDVPTYLYRFDHKAEHSVMNIIMQKETQGVPHYDDMPFLFNMPVFGVPKYTGKDHEVQERFLTLWTNFAKTGSPTEDNRWDVLKPSEGETGYYRFSTDRMDDLPWTPHQEFYDARAERVELQ